MQPGAGGLSAARLRGVLSASERGHNSAKTGVPMRFRMKVGAMAMAMAMAGSIAALVLAGIPALASSRCGAW